MLHKTVQNINFWRNFFFLRRIDRYQVIYKSILTAIGQKITVPQSCYVVCWCIDPWRIKIADYRGKARAGSKWNGPTTLCKTQKCPVIVCFLSCQVSQLGARPDARHQDQAGGGDCLVIPSQIQLTSTPLKKQQQQLQFRPAPLPLSSWVVVDSNSNYIADHHS